MTDREHIEQLAADLDVTVEFIAPRFGAAADRANRVVYVEPPEGPEDDGAYFSGLHELGHIAAEQLVGPGERGLAFMVAPEHILHDEAQATKWALDNMRRPLTQGLREEIGGNLGSYFRGTGIFPNALGAAEIRALFEALGELELPWPKTNAAFQAARLEYA